MTNLGGLDNTKYFSYEHSGCGQATHYYGEGECDTEGCNRMYSAGSKASNHNYSKNITVYDLGCNKTTSTIDSYKIAY